MVDEKKKDELKSAAYEVAGIMMSTAKQALSSLKTEDAQELIIALATVIMSEANEIRLQRSKLSPDIEEVLRELRQATREDMVN